MDDIENVGDDEPKKFMLFGRNVGEIPCFRESFLNGILGGTAIGIGTFMRTSKPRQACNMAMASYTLITMAYWTYCRYTWSQTKFMSARIQEGMRQHAMYQGTDLERQMREEFKREELKDA